MWSSTECQSKNGEEVVCTDMAGVSNRFVSNTSSELIHTSIYIEKPENGGNKYRKEKKNYNKFCKLCWIETELSV